MTKTAPGKYYGRTWDGRLEPIDGVPVQTPDAIICRRVADYPHQVPPAGAVRGFCQTCGAVIAYNPKGPHQDRPRICMQCAQIQPLPIES